MAVCYGGIGHYTNGACGGGYPSERPQTIKGVEKWKKMELWKAYKALFSPVTGFCLSGAALYGLPAFRVAVGLFGGLWAN
jgi:hypothetical protein